MKSIARLFIHLILNGLALWLAARYITGFTIEGGIMEIIIMACVLIVLNVTLRPILTFLFGPLIILTFGIALIVVHALVLYVLDILFKNLRIDSTLALLEATLLIGIINLIFHLGTTKET